MINNDQKIESLRAAAIDYCDKGYSVIHVDYGSKNPNRPKWPKERNDRRNVERLFSTQANNIGVLTGEPSGGLIDIDLDHPAAIAAADQFLPPTPAVFGRPGKPRSHRIYRCTEAPKTRQHKARCGDMIVELRSTGAQTIFPPSAHESGELIAWEDGYTEPALVEAKELMRAVKALALHVRGLLGEEIHVQPSSPALLQEGNEGNVERCRQALQHVALTDKKDGSHRLYVCACRTVEYDLNEQDALSLLQEYQLAHPFPQIWVDEEILKRIHDAEKDCVRGSALKRRQRRNLPPSSGERTVTAKMVDVEITPEEYVINDTVATALQGDRCLYQRGCHLVRIQSEPLTTSSNILVPRIVTIETATLREQITRYVKFAKRNKKDELVDVHPPGWCVQAVHARGEWDRIPHLTGIVEHPVLRPDGSILAVNGYDPGNRLIS